MDQTLVAAAEANKVVENEVFKETVRAALLKYVEDHMHADHRLNSKTCNSYNAELKRLLKDADKDLAKNLRKTFGIDVNNGASIEYNKAYNCTHYGYRLNKSTKKKDIFSIEDAESWNKRGTEYVASAYDMIRLVTGEDSPTFPEKWPRERGSGQAISVGDLQNSPPANGDSDVDVGDKAEESDAIGVPGGQNDGDDKASDSKAETVAVELPDQDAKADDKNAGKKPNGKPKGSKKRKKQNEKDNASGKKGKKAREEEAKKEDETEVIQAGHIETELIDGVAETLYGPTKAAKPTTPPKPIRVSMKGWTLAKRANWHNCMMNNPVILQKVIQHQSQCKEKNQEPCQKFAVYAIHPDSPHNFPPAHALYNKPLWCEKHKFQVYRTPLGVFPGFEFGKGAHKDPRETTTYRKHILSDVGKRPKHVGKEKKAPTPNSTLDKVDKEMNRELAHIMKDAPFMFDFLKNVPHEELAAGAKQADSSLGLYKVSDSSLGDDVDVGDKAEESDAIGVPGDA